MKDAEFAETLRTSMEELHAEGQNWLYVLDMVKQIAVHDEHYMSRYRIISRVLSVIGIHRPDKPLNVTTRYTGMIYPALVRLERAGDVESQWQYPDAPQGEHGRRQYRLVPTGLPDEPAYPVTQ